MLDQQAPIGAPRAAYRTLEGPPPETAEKWQAAATTLEGSWWPEWHQWLAERSGATSPAPVQLGSDAHPALDGVPGNPLATGDTASLLLPALPPSHVTVDARPIADADGALLEDEIRARRARPPTLWGYLSQLTAVAGWSSYPWLHHISAPTLVLSGGRDPIVPPINARILARRIPDATVHIVPDAGHLLLMEHAMPCASSIHEFLTDAG